MKALLPLLLLFSIFSNDSRALNLKNGDLILEAIPCHLCSLIEAEEKSVYSHMGVLVNDGGTWKVMEAWGKVSLTPLAEFQIRRKKEVPSLILRAIPENKKFPFNPKRLLDLFREKFAGHNYDTQFLWNNEDAMGEKLYCSELAAKLINPFLFDGIPTKPMHFIENRSLWIRYFRGNPPDGEPGLAPSDFERSPLFRKVGFL